MTPSKPAPNWAVIGLIAALTLGRLLAAHLIPLTEDEAYYRLWAQHLHLGYYDHPPMIAWWIAAGVSLLGDTSLGVRLVPALAAGLATWLIADITRALGGDRRTQFRAALWYNATLTIGLGGILATPDAPAIFFWLSTLCALARTHDQRRWWLLAGLTAGLACISKYSALFLAPGVFLWMCLTVEGRKALKTPWPWATVVLAGLIFSSNVIWNANNDWLTFNKQFGRVAPGQVAPKYLGDLIVAQFFLLGPVIAFYLARGLAMAWRELRQPKPWLLPSMTSLPFAAYLVFHSLHDRVQAHWPAPIFASLVVVAVFAAERSSQANILLRRLGIGLGLALSIAALTVMAIQPNWALGRVDPVLAIRGWGSFAKTVEQTRLDQEADWVGVAGYGTLAQLSATKALSVPVVQLIERGRYRDPAPTPDLSRPGLIVDLARRLKRQDLEACFASVGPSLDLHRGLSQGPNARYAAFKVSGPKVDVLDRGCPNDLGKNPVKPAPAPRP